MNGYEVMAIQSFACFHIRFLLPMSGAVAYLMPCICLLVEILTSLYTYDLRL